ncbi:hypothetical protein EL22_28900 [Halostagnicola sp. A56]|nr:hypothetical protein EL22_28900 [Halostagnicola sp. A56]
MNDYLGKIPWGNLWRWIVSSLLFFFVFVFLLILATSVGVLDDGTVNIPLQLTIIVSSIVIGSIRYSFLRRWLAKFRGVLKHHLQGYLNFLGLKLNSPDDWFEKQVCYNVLG